MLYPSKRKLEANDIITIMHPICKKAFLKSRLAKQKSNCAIGSSGSIIASTHANLFSC